MSGAGIIIHSTPRQFTTDATHNEFGEIPAARSSLNTVVGTVKSFGREGRPDEERVEYAGSAPLSRWERWRLTIQEPAAEFLGTAILVGFGTAVNCQVSLTMNPRISSAPKGDWTSLSFGWAIGIILGIVVSGNISGGHINPAVTLSLAVFRGFPWRKVPGYIFSQLFGAFFGSLIVYANYINAIDVQEGGRHIRTTPGTASLFATFPLPFVTSVSAFFQEFIVAAVLLIAVLAATDNSHPTSPLYVPTVVGITLLGIAIAFGSQTGFAANPARDLGPRIMTAVVGYGRAPFNFRNQYWLWCPIIATIAGGLFGSLLYDFVFFSGPKSIFNSRRRLNARTNNVDISEKAQGLTSIRETEQRDEAVFRPERASQATMVPV